MKFIDPIAITDGLLTSSSLTEADYPAWSSGTVYAAGDRVILTSTHRIYQRVSAGSSPTAPNLDAVNWVDVGPTNKWAPFDQAVGTAATSGAATTMTWTITPGQVVTGLALLDMSCDSVTVSVAVGATTLYSRTYDPTVSSAGIADWYAWFFESIDRRTSLVDTNLPAFSEAVITVTLSGTAPLLLGTLALGRPFTLGTTLAGSKVSIVDYSTKTTDAFGTTTVVPRSYAKRLECNVIVSTPQASAISKRLADTRASPVVWIGEQDVDATLVYGWCREWAVELQYPTVSQCSLSIEGLV